MDSGKKVIGLHIPLVVVVGLLLTATSIKAPGQEQVLHSFNGRDGFFPVGVILDAAGNLYGTTTFGSRDSKSCHSGSNGCGTIFKLSLGQDGKWTTTVLYSFNANGKQGSNPYAGLVMDAAGSLYGTTWLGGNVDICGSGCGTVFKLSPSGNGKWTETVLHSFHGKDGANPYAGLVFDTAGNLYGTTWMGGTESCDCGVIFKLSPGTNGKWTEAVLHSFNGKDGANPYAGLVFDTAGNLYGTTFSTTDGESTVFKLTPGANGKWTHAVAHAFNGKDGENLYAGVVVDAEGNLFGAAAGGGAYGDGTIFKLTPGTNGKWGETVLHDFNGKDGAGPQADVALDATGNLYGTTVSGGNSKSCIGCGTVFKLSLGADRKWTEMVLHSFNGHDGKGPALGNLIFDTARNLYGTTIVGGNRGYGVVFELK
jgi:uncharacterized repeat protein (TIGR03803 family)